MVIYNGDQGLTCGICHKKIEVGEKIYQDKITHSIACSACNDLFSKEDLEMVINIFLAHGGYFGKFKSLASNYDLNYLFKEYKKSRDLKLEQMNILLLHQALLYGITPTQLLVMLGQIIS